MRRPLCAVNSPPVALALLFRAYTHEHQLSLLTLACARMIEERIALVIVDSSMALFRVDFTGRGQLAERQNK